MIGGLRNQDIALGWICTHCRHLRSGQYPQYRPQNNQGKCRIYHQGFSDKLLKKGDYFYQDLLIEEYPQHNWREATEDDNHNGSTLVRNTTESNLSGLWDTDDQGQKFIPTMEDLAEKYQHTIFKVPWKELIAQRDA